MPTDEMMARIAEAANDAQTQLDTDTANLAQMAALILLGRCATDPYGVNLLRDQVGNLALLASFRTAGRHPLPSSVASAIEDLMRVVEPLV